MSLHFQTVQTQMHEDISFTYERNLFGNRVSSRSVNVKRRFGIRCFLHRLSHNLLRFWAVYSSDLKKGVGSSPKRQQALSHHAALHLKVIVLHKQSCSILEQTHQILPKPVEVNLNFRQCGEKYVWKIRNCVHSWRSWDSAVSIAMAKAWTAEWS